MDLWCIFEIHFPNLSYCRRLCNGYHHALLLLQVSDFVVIVTHVTILYYSLEALFHNLLTRFCCPFRVIHRISYYLPYALFWFYSSSYFFFAKNTNPNNIWEPPFSEWWHKKSCLYLFFKRSTSLKWRNVSDNGAYRWFTSLFGSGVVKHCFIS